MIGYWISLSLPKNDFLFSLNQKLVLGSNFLFAFTLFLRWVEQGYFPLSNLYESLIFLSWGISFVHLFVEKKTKSRLIGAISSPIIFFLSAFSSLTLPTEMQKALPLVPSLQSNWLMMHVSMMMVSYSTLIVGSLLSLFYLAFDFFIQKKGVFKSNFSFSSFFPFLSKNMAEKNLKNLETQEKELNTLSSLSSLSSSQFNSSLFFELDSNKKQNKKNVIDLIDLTVFNDLTEKKEENIKYSLLQTIDIWSYRVIGLGFPFLTIGIISGAVWANEAWGSYWSWDPKETWALITWLVFAIYLHSRLLKGWQGEKTAWIGSVGFFVIWICYLGVNFLGKGLHSYGWVLN
jgi:cytochrome c-type biogenesis protein CcsB